MNVGDRIIAKEDILYGDCTSTSIGRMFRAKNCVNTLFKKNNVYTIKTMWNLNICQIYSNSVNELIEFSIREHRDVFQPPQLSEYFYTEREFRKLKLNRLNESIL